LALDESTGPRAGRLYCIYADDAVAGNGMDVWCRHSDDKGSAWTDPVRINDDRQGVVRDQFHPWAACDEDGILTAIWYDRRDDPTDHLWHIYMSRSDDGGETWSPNVRITSVPSSPEMAKRIDGPTLGDRRLESPGHGPLEQLHAGLIGEYSGVAVRAGVIHPIWTDTRNGNQDTYASVGDVTGIAGAPSASSGLVLRMTPNPSRGRTDLSLNLPLTGTAALRIYDSAGRLLRSLDLPATADEERHASWDGRDDGGRSVPSGIYFLRLEEGSGAVARGPKLILLR